MGKTRFNAKGRQNFTTLVDDSETKKIKIIDNGDVPEYGGYDASNALVLPSNKRQTKVNNKTIASQTFLSKKKRKLLLKIVDKKKKKEGRASLLESLATVQIAEADLKQYTSIVQAQTRGNKRAHQAIPTKRSASSVSTEGRLSSIAGCNKKKRLSLLEGYNNSVNDSKKSKNLNIVSLEQSSSEDECEEENEVDMNLNDVTPMESNAEDKSEENEADMIDAKEPTPEMKQETLGKKEEPKLVKMTEYKPAVYVHVERTPSIQVARLKLPILAEEQSIMETINDNSIIIIAGETGSGKTTQVPQFLYEAGYAQDKMIGITEPRRVAAISMSKRVGIEMNLGTNIVSYLIRFEGNATEQTRIKFMTDGVLLKEIERDFTLNKYSVIILDEAHERSVYTDILVGLLSRIVPMRLKRGSPLKLIIMSATLRVEDFTSNTHLFKIPPPVLKVEARQFPVTIHFNKRTNDDYVKDCFTKTVKIHTQLPEGGILIFVTGQQEVNYLVKKLRKSFPGKLKKGDIHSTKQEVPLEPDLDELEALETEFDMKQAIKNSRKARKNALALPQIDLDTYQLPTDDADADLHDDSEIEDTDDENDGELLQGLKSVQPLWVLPMYSLLSSEKQARVFEAPPEGTRLCVVSTNVAETSLTIPNVKYVVDCGRQKTRLYDKVTGVSSFVISYSSRASADQRAGRAGRTAPGHCYRLYSSAVYNDEFQAFSMPDIQKKPVDDLMLQMKCMGIDKVVNFPFPSPPDLTQLEAADKKLKLLGALEDQPVNAGKELISKVTPLGLAISAFPVAPRFGKMLALSHQQNLLPYTVCMVAALSVQEVLQEVSLSEQQNVEKSKWHQKRLAWVGTTGHTLHLGDPMVLLRAVGAAEYANSNNQLETFCEQNGLRQKAITEIRKLRMQLTNEINLNIPDVDLLVDPKLPPPTDMQAKLLRQVLLAGMGDQVARKISPDKYSDPKDKVKYKYAYEHPEMEEPIFMHTASVLRKKQPEWVIYQEVYELQQGDGKKMFARGITAIEPEWLLLFATKLCNIRAVKEEPAPRFNGGDGKIYCYVDATYGRAGWELPLTEIEMPLTEKACRYFGMFFLDGKVIKQLETYKKRLRSAPGSLVKTWSNINPTIVSFVNRLISRQVNTKQKLLDVWKTDPTYLMAEYCEFLSKADVAEVSNSWPPIEKES